MILSRPRNTSLNWFIPAFVNRMVGSCAGMREEEGTRWCPRSAKKRRNSSRIQVEVRGLPVIGRPRGRAIISSRRGRPYGRGLLLSGAAGAMGARQVEDRAALTGGPSAGVLETALEGALHLALRHVGGRFDSLQLQLELVRIAGAAERLLHGDEVFLEQAVDRLVEGLHAILRRALRDRLVDQLGLVLVLDAVAHEVGDTQDLHRRHAEIGRASCRERV